MEWMEVIVSILSGLAVTIPLVVKLVEYVNKALREKNWNALLNLVMNLMKEAEGKFETGAERKSWVIDMVLASANTIQYDIDLNVVSDLIDNMCKLSKIVNYPKNEE